MFDHLYCRTYFSMDSSPLAELFCQKLAIHLAKVRDVVEDIAPQVIIVTLFLDQSFLAEHQLGRAIHGCVGVFFEHHGHNPIEDNHILILGNSQYLHLQLFRALCQPFSHSDEIVDAFDALNRILKNDIFVVIWKYM